MKYYGNRIRGLMMRLLMRLVIKNRKFRHTARKETSMSKFTREDGIISLEHCQEWNFRADIFEPIRFTTYSHGS